MKKYSKEVMDFIKNNVVGMTTKDLVDLVNSKFNTDFTESKMKSYKTNHKLKSGTPLGIPAGSPTELYPEEVRRFIKENYHGVGHKEMADLLNKTFGRNYTQMQMKAYYGRCKFDSGLTGQFSIGHVPFNKGKEKFWIGGEETQFKKGNVPVNYRPVGSERVNVDGYIEIKVADPNKWRLKHQVIWEKKSGPIPKGYAVIFGDGNTSNLNPDNLVLVSRQQLVIMNKRKLIQKDAELTRTGVIMADVFLKIGERKRKK